MVEDFAETSRKEKEMKDEKQSEEKGKTRLMQAFLKVSGDEPPRIVLQPKEKNSYPADYVPLKGVVVEMPEDEIALTEDDAWTTCGRVADLCRLGHEVEENAGNRSGLCEHLTYAYCILCDYMREKEGYWLMSNETSETLIRSAIERLVCAGKCVDFKLDEYGSDD